MARTFLDNRKRNRSISSAPYVARPNGQEGIGGAFCAAATGQIKRFLWSAIPPPATHACADPDAEMLSRRGIDDGDGPPQSTLGVGLLSSSPRASRRRYI